MLARIRNLLPFSGKCDEILENCKASVLAIAVLQLGVLVTSSLYLRKYCN